MLPGAGRTGRTITDGPRFAHAAIELVAINVVGAQVELERRILEWLTTLFKTQLALAKGIIQRRLALLD